MTTTNVSSGQVLSDITVTSGNTYNVSKGGIANNFSVSSGGVIRAGQGGVSFGGGTLNSTIINSSGIVYVAQNGIANSTTINSSGLLYLDNGGSANLTTVSSGGLINVNSSYGTGSIVTSTTVMSGGTEIVSGGTASSSVVSSGGQATLYNGASTISSIVYGNETLSSGAKGYNDKSYSDGSIIISNGATEYASGSGGTASGINVKSGGNINVISGGTNSSAIISGGGKETVSSGSYDYNTIIQGDSTGSATYFISRGGIGYGLTVNSGGTARVGQGGVSFSGGTLNSTTINSSGSVYVAQYGNINSTIVNNNGLLYLDNGGSANLTTVSSGGLINVNSSYGTGSIVTSTTVMSGGTEIVSGGTASSSIVSSGGQATLYNGASTISSIVYGNETLSNGAKGYNDKSYSDGSIIISNGATEYASGSGGTASGINVKSGGSLYVMSSGTVSGAVISSGGNFRDGLYSGQMSSSGAFLGKDIDVTIESGASATIYNGAVSISAQIMSGAYIDVGYGQAGNKTSTNQSIFSGATIFSGGSAQIENTITTSDVVLSGGTMNVVGSSADIISTLILNSGKEIIKSGNVASNNIVSSGGSLLASNGSVVSSSNIYSGGTEIISSGAKSYNDSINSGGVEVVSSGGISSNSVINDGGMASISSVSSLVNATLNYMGSIDFSFLQGSITYAGVSNSGLLTVTTSTQTVKLQLSGSYPSDDTFIISGDTVTLVCYLPGTLIRTPHGEVPVESLDIGDEVVTFNWETQSEVIRPLTWVGYQKSKLQPNLPEDQAGYPVRILKNSISDNTPHKDLLVTPEHCLFFNGKFIPARMLVNGQSIFYDRSVTSYNFYHIETEEHSVIWADGMLSESYLDTGNRRYFSNRENIINITNKNQDWNIDSAAALDVSRDTVEYIYNKIVSRAKDLKIVKNQKPKTIVKNHEMYLITNSGSKLNPIRNTNSFVTFRLPKDTTSVRIVSRSSRPCDVIGPFVDDRRNLGVLIGKIISFESDETINITQHLTNSDLNGWHNIESTDMRWTNGDATIHFDRKKIMKNETIISIQVISSGPYLKDEIIVENISIAS
ncbi:Hint domain-containing protein [Gluconobacter cerinus]|uniref:Hint domain-containing protein n=1 Tax=Gluconobacter cerinus TaxID=38307 RepID=UPI001B8C2841|nr:Hint domain-containing protein [Gluconobacter cerinus]MBS1032920.1 Hint domain-containing protein [Gluconobacter cerinus]